MKVNEGIGVGSNAAAHAFFTGAITNIVGLNATLEAAAETSTVSSMKVVEKADSSLARRASDGLSIRLRPGIDRSIFMYFGTSTNACGILE